MHVDTRCAQFGDQSLRRVSGEFLEILKYWITKCVEKYLDDDVLVVTRILTVVGPDSEFGAPEACLRSWLSSLERVGAKRHDLI